MSGGKETIAQKKTRVRSIIRKLRKDYPEPDCALEHESAWQLLVSTILSAQSTDETVNRVTRALYHKYHAPADLATAPLQQLEQDIKPTGFFRQKAKNIRAACALLVEEHAGEVPEEMEELVRLPGVARKTANVVLGTWYGKSEGIVVDTHVGRIAERLALTWNARNSKDAVNIEKDLMEIVPRRDWIYLAHALIWHGRRLCKARQPECGSCSLAGLCPAAAVSPDAPAGRRRSKVVHKPRKSTRGRN